MKPLGKRPRHVLNCGTDSDSERNDLGPSDDGRIPEPNSVRPAISSLRLSIGGCVFVAGMLAPLLVPWVIASALPTEWKAGLSGLLMLGIPEFFAVVALFILGKDAFAYMKRRIFGAFRRTGKSSS